MILLPCVGGKGGKTVWSPASRVIRREGSEDQDVWLLCEDVPVVVSAPNLQPAADAESLARQVFNDGPVILDAVARGNQEFEAHRGTMPNILRMKLLLSKRKIPSLCRFPPSCKRRKLPVPLSVRAQLARTCRIVLKAMSAACARGAKAVLNRTRKDCRAVR